MKFRSEEDFLALIDCHFPDTPDTVRLGRGDDCCILHAGSELCVSTDLFLDTIHFRQSYFSPEDIAHKALAVNLSDIAAMGGKPLAFTLELMIPESLPDNFWPRFFSGLANTANQFDVPLVGGDLSRAPYLGMGVSIWGEPGPSGRFLTRGNAQQGDLLFTVGDIGLARAGLNSLEEYGCDAQVPFPKAVAAHLRPVPRVPEGLTLSAHSTVRGLMDISDGLARDLPRFLELSGNCGASLDFSNYPLHDEVIRYAQSCNEPPAIAALLGGEDYALLGACAPQGLRQLLTSLPSLAIIGEVTQHPGISVDGKPFDKDGFDHFGG